MPARRRVKYHWRAHTLLLLTVAVLIYPLVWLVGASFKPEKQIFTTVSPFPFGFTSDNYVSGGSATSSPFSMYLANSLVVSACVVAGNLISCTLAAYAFARLDFALRRTWFAVM